MRCAVAVQLLVVPTDLAANEASRYNGVRVHMPLMPEPPRFQAVISLHGHLLIVGERATALEAARLHDLAAIALHGAGAIPFLNQPAAMYHYNSLLEVMDGLVQQ
ncbi:hypothetical protein HaLaN_25747, partial [Haematococcus lacustris]